MWWSGPAGAARAPGCWLALLLLLLLRLALLLPALLPALLLRLLLPDLVPAESRRASTSRDSFSA